MGAEDPGQAESAARACRGHQRSADGGAAASTRHQSRSRRPPRRQYRHPRTDALRRLRPALRRPALRHDQHLPRDHGAGAAIPGRPLGAVAPLCERRRRPANPAQPVCPDDTAGDGAGDQRTGPAPRRHDLVQLGAGHLFGPGRRSHPAGRTGNARPADADRLVPGYRAGLRGLAGDGAAADRGGSLHRLCRIGRALRELHPSAHDPVEPALDLFGLDLTLIAIIGLLMLIGIVKKNAIMMIDFALERRRHQHLSAEEAIYEAAILRFRPIMMTTMAAIFGMLPIAVGFGAGASLRQPLGIAVVGGLVVSQALTLFTIPLTYVYMDRLSAWLARLGRRRRGAPPRGPGAVPDRTPAAVARPVPPAVPDRHAAE